MNRGGISMSAPFFIPNKKKNTIFAIPSNVCIQAIYNIFTMELFNTMLPNMLPMRAVANFLGQLDRLSVQDRQYVTGLDESKLGRIASFHDISIGMSIMVAQNEESLKGFTNCTFGIIEDVQFAKDTKFKVNYDEFLIIDV